LANTHGEKQFRVAAALVTHFVMLQAMS